jgi:ABC-type branched-subunit amino acid transport system substrate-binding protein
MIVQTYSPDTTSFAPILAPIMPALKKGAALLVPDHLSRVELLVRQLARAGRVPSVDGSDGALVLSTAEGASPAALKPGSEVLEGLWLAPAAAETAEAQAFVQAYTAGQGEPPGDQALLVFQALRRAVGGSGDVAVRPTLMRVHRGKLVAVHASQG